MQSFHHPIIDESFPFRDRLDRGGFRFHPRFCDVSQCFVLCVKQHGRHLLRCVWSGSDATGQIDPEIRFRPSFAPLLKEVHPFDRQI